MSRDYSVNWSKRIRDWLSTQDGPRSSAQIRTALGLTPKFITKRIGVMVASGVLIKSGTWPGCVYTLGREARRPPTYGTQEERQAARREDYRRYRMRKNGESAPKRYAKPVPKPKPAPQPKAEKVVRLKSAPAKQQPTYVEPVAAFLARGGRIERLHPAECSHPLKRIGWQPGKRKQAA